jgi:AcrR family transcriptional regulator
VNEEDAPPLRRDAWLNQQRILAAATAAVHREGPNVPMAVIASAAGVGVGTLYRRYPNREALLDALACRSFGIVLDNARAAEAAPGTALDALAHFFDRTLNCRDELILPLHGGPASVSEQAAALRAQAHQALRRILGRGHREGTVRADATPADVIYFGALLAQPLAATGDWDTIARRLQRIYLDGLST